MIGDRKDLKLDNEDLEVQSALQIMIFQLLWFFYQVDR